MRHTLVPFGSRSFQLTSAPFLHQPFTINDAKSNSNQQQNAHHNDSRHCSRTFSRPLKNHFLSTINPLTAVCTLPTTQAKTIPFVVTNPVVVRAVVWTSFDSGSNALYAHTLSIQTKLVFSAFRSFHSHSRIGDISTKRKRSTLAQDAAERVCVTAFIRANDW